MGKRQWQLPPLGVGLNPRTLRTLYREAGNETFFVPFLYPCLW